MHLFPSLNAILRRAWILIALAAPFIGGISSAQASTPAEIFISDSIHNGVEILNNKQLTSTQRHEQFKTFLLGIADVKHIAVFTLGQYALTASPADEDAFAAAFQDYAVAGYRSYFAKYASQTLKVTGSSQRAPDDFIVMTNLIDPRDHSGQPPLEVDFRVRTDSGTPVLVDFSVAGIWLALEERDQFSTFLSQNNGNIQIMTSHLRDVAKRYR
jgi:phospholipid transport system substrate-binding protein